MKIDWSVCHKHSAIKSFDFFYAGIQLHFKQLNHLENEKYSNTEYMNMCDWILKY